MVNAVDVSDGHKVLLWDIDGTLISLGADPLGPFRLALAGKGWLACADLDVNVHGSTDLGICEALLRERRSADDTLPRSHELLREVERVTLGNASVLRGREVLPGALPVLVRAATLGWTNALVTGNSRKRAEAKLDAVGLRSQFDWTLSGFGDESTERSELVMLVGNSAMRRVAGQSDGSQQALAIVVIGDTPLDMRARRLGDGGIGVATGAYSELDLRDAGADLTVASLESGHDAIATFLSGQGGRRPRQ
jgi:phosphoglycolate phosphatase-like HAD superfamily hydrolase